MHHDYIKTAAKFGGVAQTRIFFANKRIESNPTHREAVEAKEAVEDNVTKEAGVAAKGGVVKVKEVAQGDAVVVKEAVRNSLVKEAVRNSRSKKLC